MKLITPTILTRPCTTNSSINRYKECKEEAARRDAAELDAENRYCQEENNEKTQFYRKNKQIEAFYILNEQEKLRIFEFSLIIE